MNFIGLDFHKINTQLCAFNKETGELIQERYPTLSEKLLMRIKELKPQRILLEASTESEWFAQELEEMNICEVVVADPNFAPMYEHSRRSAKTDKRDAEALARACENGVFLRAHRRSEESRMLMMNLRSRHTVIKARTSLILEIRSSLRSRKIRMKKVETSAFHKEFDALDAREFRVVI